MGYRLCWWGSGHSRTAPCLLSGCCSVDLSGRYRVTALDARSRRTERPTTSVPCVLWWHWLLHRIHVRRGRLSKLGADRATTARRHCTHHCWRHEATPKQQPHGARRCSTFVCTHVFESTRCGRVWQPAWSTGSHQAPPHDLPSRIKRRANRHFRDARHCQQCLVRSQDLLSYALHFIASISSYFDCCTTSFVVIIVVICSYSIAIRL